MKRLLLGAVLAVAACEAPQTPKPYGVDLPPLTANGLPGTYEVCARSAALKTAAMYDVYYPCHSEIMRYVAQMNGMTQQDKASLIDEMEKRALNYAQAQAEARHGADAVRRASAPVDMPPATPAPQASLGTQDEMARARVWARCSLEAIQGAYQAGLEAEAIIARTRATCGHLWDGSQATADRLYSKMLASVRGGLDPGYSVSPAVPAGPREMRF